MIKYIILYNLIAFSIVLAQQPIVTGEDPRYPGSTGNYENTTYDTTSLKMARERAIEANVAMESPISKRIGYANCCRVLIREQIRIDACNHG